MKSRKERKKMKIDVIKNKNIDYAYTYIYGVLVEVFRIHVFDDNYLYQHYRAGKLDNNNHSYYDNMERAITLA